MYTHKFRLPLGVKVECIVTGFKGTITCRSEHMNKCDRYLVDPPCPKGKNEMRESYWIDDGQLKLIPEPKIESKKTKKPGGSPSTKS